MRSENTAAARPPRRWASLTFLAGLSLAGCVDGNRVGHGAPTPPVKAEIRVYKSPAELFADMPQEAYPKGGAGERKAADEWVARNRAGQEVEWTATVKGVSVGQEDRIVRISLEGEEPTAAAGDGARTSGWPWGEPFAFDAEKCQTRITRVACGPVSAGTAKKLGEWQGKEVKLRALVTRVEFGSESGRPLGCYLEVALRAIDDYVPTVQKESMRPQK
jgi:hypothetical protein